MKKNIIKEKRLDEFKVKCPIIPNVLIQGLKIINGFIILGIQLKLERVTIIISSYYHEDTYKLT